MFRPRRERSPKIVILVNPTDAEIDVVRERYKLHPLLVDDLREGHQQPKFERPGAHLYLSLWDMNADATESDVASESDLAIIFDEDVLILVQRGERENLRDLDAVLTSVGMIPITSTLAAVHRVLDAIVSDFVTLGTVIERELAAIETEVFDSTVREDFRQIYRLRGKIGTIDRASTGLADALRAAQPQLHNMTRKEPFLRPYFLHLKNDAVGAAGLASAHHKGLDAVVASHESNVSTRQNQDMRTISAYAALLAIPTVVSGIYGMNFENLPLLHWEFGWVVVMIATLLLDVVAFVFFRHQGWLGGAPATRRDGERADDP